MERSIVKTEIRKARFLLGLIQKGDLAIGLIGDKETRVLYVFGNEGLEQCIRLNRYRSKRALYRAFVSELGDCSKKRKDSSLFTGSSTTFTVESKEIIDLVGELRSELE